MAAYHSGVLVLIDDLSKISYFLIDRVASTIRKVELNGPRNVDKIYAVKMSRKYLCFATNGSVLVYLRQGKDLYFQSELDTLHHRRVDDIVFRGEKIAGVSLRISSRTIAARYREDSTFL
jgi:hypothetical protein